MARSERAKQLQRYLESTGRKLPAQRTGANRNAYIDFDVTGKADLSEEGGPLSPGNGLPLGGLIQGGEGYGLYGGLHSEQIMAIPSYIHPHQGWIAARAQKQLNNSNWPM